MQQRLLSRVEVAEYLAAKGQPVAVATLAKYATIGGGPTFRKFGRRVRYSPDALDTWASNKLSPPRCSTSDAGEGHIGAVPSL
jgi:hypothetical protein